MAGAIQQNAFQNDAFQVGGNFGHGQAQADIKQTSFALAQANADIKQTYPNGIITAYQEDAYDHETFQIDPNGPFGQAQAYILASGGTLVHAQAQADILQIYFAHAQANASIKSVGFGHGQAQATIVGWAFGQTQGDILQTYFVYAQAQAFILKSAGYGQANSDIKQVYRVFAQAQAKLRVLELTFGQAQGQVKKGYLAHAQAIALIDSKRAFAQAQAYIRRGAFAQAQAFIGNLKYGQAQALIVPNIAATDPERYFIVYNNYVLPGYAQGEAFISEIKIEGVQIVGYDGEPLEQRGLRNKEITLRLLILDTTYQEAKNQLQDAITYLRSTKGWARLYVKRFDRYYLAKTNKVTMSQEAGRHERALEYTITFEAKPWLYGVAEHNITLDDI